MTTTEDHPRTVITPERRAALEDHIADYLLIGDRVPALVLRDAVEHGWQGATADIAERLEAIEAAGGGLYDLLKEYRRLADSLKREVGA